MKLISWNVNGLRAVLKKNFVDFVLAEDPEILCLQETKARPEQVELPLDLAHYRTYWNSAEKAGYSGTAIFSKTPALSVRYGLGDTAHDAEGRVITLEFEDWFLVTVYTPNSQNGLKRLPYRQDWDAAFLRHLQKLEAEGKPVIFCGDLNVARHEIDLARPKENRKSPGFSDEERAGFEAIAAAGFIDTFRHFYPEMPDRYSWWSYRAGARARNVGWRIDYFCTSARIIPQLKRAEILDQIPGSDHCPVLLEL